MEDVLVGVMGGSGLYRIDALEDVTEQRIATPFGAPSDALAVGRVGGVRVAFLARHGRVHSLVPAEVPYRANIWAMKKLGVRYLLSMSAVGSLHEDIAPLDMVIPDQFIDMTRQRIGTFFGGGAVAHVSMADPVCGAVADILARAVQAVSAAEPITLHRGGTYLCIDGPQFSSQAESHWYRSMGASVIGMTNMPEAKLAREAQMAYATLAMATDYDCWHPREAHVTADAALANLLKNAERAQRVVVAAIGLLGRERPPSQAHTALAGALVTQPASMSAEVRARLAPLLDGMQ